MQTISLLDHVPTELTEDEKSRKASRLRSLHRFQNRSRAFKSWLNKYHPDCVAMAHHHVIREDDITI